MYFGACIRRGCCQHFTQVTGEPKACDIRHRQRTMGTQDFRRFGIGMQGLLNRGTDPASFGAAPAMSGKQRACSHGLG